MGVGEGDSWMNPYVYLNLAAQGIQPTKLNPGSQNDPHRLYNPFIDWYPSTGPLMPWWPQANMGVGEGDSWMNPYVYKNLRAGLQKAAGPAWGGSGGGGGGGGGGFGTRFGWGGGGGGYGGYGDYSGIPSWLLGLYSWNIR